MVMADESTLAYALLGLLHGAPQSGYDLRKTFVSTPMSVFSDSPGAIYPALRRLVRRRWIAPVAAPRGGRRRRVFAPTELGRRAFAAWLGRPPGRDDVVRRWDVSMLRLAFMDAAGPEPLLRFLEALQAELRVYLAELEAFQAAHTRAMPAGAQLAFASGVEGCRAQARWVRGAVERVRKQRRKR
jgi:DNA-binding PadR family transcriptional regulator